MSYRDITVARTSDFTDGDMKQVSVEGKEILLARVNGNFYAVGATCTHYGAPLVEGVLNGERLVCPRHHACFNITTGDLREPPAFDALPRYDVQIENEHVVVRVPVDDALDRRTPSMMKRDGKDERLFVIAGAGFVGQRSSASTRQKRQLNWQMARHWFAMHC